ncbi:MAG TPA: glucoamylase family protein [Tepidisphaeraceae bacterium]
MSGSAAYAGGVYAVGGAGSDIGGTADQFHFTYNSWSGGDGTIIAKVASLTNTDASAKAGVMFRSGTAADAAFAGIFVTPSTGITFVSRTSDGGTSGQTISPGFHAPRYVELTRAGAQVSAFYSADGIAWTQLGASQTISLGAAPLAGLAVSSHNTSTACIGSFSNAALLPSGWNNTDIGSPPLPGTAAYNASQNSFALSGSGNDIGGTSDQFNFVNRTMTGDGSIVAHIDSLTNTDPVAKAGIMIRSDNTASAAFAAIEATAQNGLVFQWRPSAAAVASSATAGSISSPIWLRLTQLGGNFSAYYSSDDVHWTQIGTSQSVTMSSATTFAGLGVTSHNGSALNSASVSAVSIVQGGWSDLDIGSPALAGSASYDPPSNTYTLTGSGSGFDGTSDQFNFASRTMSGNGSVIAYINSVTNPGPSAKAGLMVRADNTPASVFAGAFVSPSGGLFFEWRTSAGSQVQQQTVGAVAAPVSLKLTRTGNSFTAFYSTDGINWLPIGSAQSVIMPNTTAAGIAAASGSNSALCTASFTGVSVGSSPPPGSGVYSASDELFLNDLENREFLFFYNETNPATGLVPDGALANGGSNGSACSIASLGFGLTALTIGDQRGWISHANAYQRVLTTVNLLYNTAAQVNGFYYHFLNTSTGARSGTSELSSVDTAELMAGVLNVAQYWAGTAVQTTAMNIFNRVNWPFMQKPNGQFYGAWVPEGGGAFSGGYVDFSEAVVLYLLALGSQTHPVSLSSWLSWSRTPTVTYAGMTFKTATDSALFTVQYPQAWYDLRGLSDSTGLNYYQNAQTATLAQRQWMIDISPTWPDYGPNMWGLTASQGPSGYTVWGGPPAFGPIDGTVVPTAPGGSLAFVPRQTVDALRNMYQTFGTSVYQKYGLIDAFNPLTNWKSPIVLGIDLGMTLIAAENSRSNFVWNVFSQSPVARQSLASAFPSLSPQLVSAASRKTNPSSIVTDIPLNTGADLTVEPREGGPTQLVLTFGANIVKGSNFAISLTSGGGGPDGFVVSSIANGSTLTINLSGVANGQTLVVNINDVRNNSVSASGAYTLNVGVLAGDANQDRVVDQTDLGIVSANWQQSPRTFAQGDFTGDGIVNVNDLDLLAKSWQMSLPMLTASPAPKVPVKRPVAPVSAAAQSRAVTPISAAIGLIDDLSGSSPGSLLLGDPRNA